MSVLTDGRGVEFDIIGGTVGIICMLGYVQAIAALRCIDLPCLDMLGHTWYGVMYRHGSVLRAADTHITYLEYV